jgi:hypothetical protein
MLFATLDVDLPDDPLFIALESAGEQWPWWWIRLIQIAKRHNRRGRLCHSDGRPLAARDLALVHHRTLQRAEEWGQMLETCLGLGLLVQDDDGAYRIADWKRWHRSPSDDPEETRTRKALQRERQRSHDLSRGVTSGHDLSRGVTSGHESHDTEQSRAEQRQSRAEQQQSMRAHAREGLAAAAAADVAVAPEDDLGPESESLYTGRPGRTSLDELRPAIAQAMQALGILGSPSGTWWTSVTAWAGPAVEEGATLDDVRDAIHFAAAKAAHDRPRRPWPYAMTIASEEIGQIARRNQMRRDWAAHGRRGPEPLPYVWTPEDDTCSR